MLCNALNTNKSTKCTIRTKQFTINNLKDTGKLLQLVTKDQDKKMASIKESLKPLTCITMFLPECKYPAQICFRDDFRGHNSKTHTDNLRRAHSRFR